LSPEFFITMQDEEKRLIKEEEESQKDQDSKLEAL
jgi:hypothetical protein